MTRHKLITVQCERCGKFRSIRDPGGPSRMPRICQECNRDGLHAPIGSRARIRQCSRCGVVEGGECLHEVLSKVGGKLLCQECKEEVA